MLFLVPEWKQSSQVALQPYFGITWVKPVNLETSAIKSCFVVFATSPPEQSWRNKYPMIST
jgi:hypothetical protein